VPDPGVEFGLLDPLAQGLVLMPRSRTISRRDFSLVWTNRTAS
jgi:hypothetical protein